MRFLAKYIFAGIVAILGPQGASMATAQQAVIVGLDISKSNAFITDQAVASRAASYMAGIIESLSRSDVVRVRTLGDYGMRANPLRLDLVVSRKTPARKIAATVQRLVEALPTLVAEGRVQASGTTQISAFLIDEARSLECTGKAGGFYLLSDGIEASQATNPKALTNGKTGLPTPPTGVLSNCQLTMLGIGETVNGANSAHTRNLIAAWQAWAEHAGADFIPKPVF
ncbi:hypothetical protein [Chromatocurvus halotolerans]|uniref:VWFA domain-containing protein n=1 Tax=Chromatocurvus halotolerans TaxID=1132028 RepID=A0A4R2KQD6_9GAMM|nr:hypothetical protein [Chromatocurvus halotolerans]TCO75824.1 hypothetical protein EV688_10613 [Chromatocurvus halotolerans]